LFGVAQDNVLHKDPCKQRVKEDEDNSSSIILEIVQGDITQQDTEAIVMLPILPWLEEVDGWCDPQAGGPHSCQN